MPHPFDGQRALSLLARLAVVPADDGIDILESRLRRETVASLPADDAAAGLMREVPQGS
jgi:hypothetical protein